MTSLLRALCLLLLAFTLPACSDDAPELDPAAEPAVIATQAEPEQPASPTLPPPAEIEAHLPSTNVFNRAWTGDLDVMEGERLIRVLTVYSVGRYYLDGGEEKGLVYEMFNRFEHFINKRLKRGLPKVHVVIIPVARNQLLPALLEGRGDLIAAGLTVTPERADLVDFSTPASKPVSEILVTGPSAPALESIDDLAGQTLYLRHSSSYRESVEVLNQRFVKEGRKPVHIASLSSLLEDDDLIEMVNSGLMPWAIVDDYKTQLWEGVFDDLVIRDDIVFRSQAHLAYAFRKGSPKLEVALNEFLKTHRAGTLVGNVLLNRYLRDFDWAANALEQDDYQRFEGLTELFQTYGERYDLDHLMLAAQGYQESRLDQSVRSGAGAVGVMQILPTTAADSNVNIKGIHLLEPNIHAGVKYLSYLRNRYFSDPTIDPLNQTLLALAAYNAGPSRMINLRNKAKKRGYDPNVWFDNVEVIAAKDIGRETVQYVANIYKYHLAYRLALEQQDKITSARESAGIR